MWLQAFYTDTCFATTGSSVCLFIVTYAYLHLYSTGQVTSCTILCWLLGLILDQA